MQDKNYFESLKKFIETIFNIKTQESPLALKLYM